METTATKFELADFWQSSQWVDRPTGGALQVSLAHHSAGPALELELVWAKGRPWWFWHVMNVPLEVEAGIS